MSHVTWLIWCLNRFLFISSWATFSATFDEIRSSGMLWTALRFAFSVRGSGLMFDSKFCFFCFSLSIRKSRPQAAHKSFYQGWNFNETYYMLHIVFTMLCRTHIIFNTILHNDFMATWVEWNNRWVCQQCLINFCQ